MVNDQIARAPHYLRLASAPFDAIVSGQKTIESRLYDEKLQAIQLGDTIIFTHREDPRQTITARVVGLLRYTTFRDLKYVLTPSRYYYARCGYQVLFNWSGLGYNKPRGIFARLVVRKMSGYHPRSLREEIG